MVSARMTPAARVAWGVLVICLVAWMMTFVLRQSGSWVSFARHGLEGAFVGGLCDAFAIWRMYVAIEVGYEALSSEVARFVVREIARPDNLIADVRSVLDSQATSDALVRLLKERFPSARQLEAACLDFWESDLEPVVLNRMVHANLDAWVARSGTNSATSLTADPRVRAVLRHCLSAAISDEARAKRLHALIDLAWFQKLGFTDDKLLKRLKQLAASLDEPPSPTMGNAGILATDYLRSYIAAWTGLPEDERRAAAEKLLEVLVPLFMKKAAELLWEERNELIQFLATGARISRHPFVELVLRQIEPVVARSPDFLEGVLRSKLQQLGGVGVRALIERNTRGRLDGIQLNGTLLGALVGLAVGGMSWAMGATFLSH